jgi:hypothetical protein
MSEYAKEKRSIVAACKYLARLRFTWNPMDHLVILLCGGFRKVTFIRYRYLRSLANIERINKLEADQARNKESIKMFDYFENIGIKEFLVEATKDYYEETGIMGWFQAKVAMRTHWNRLVKEEAKEQVGA